MAAERRQVPGVVVRAAGGEEHGLVAGDLLGRGARSSVPLEDPRISEAHAMVSLREAGFVLLALRGSVWTGHHYGPEVAMTPGTSVRLAEGVELEVVRVHLPALMLALEGVGDEPFLLQHSTLSLFEGPPVRLSAGFQRDADAWIWSSDGHWWVGDAQDVSRPLDVGDTVHVGEATLAVVGVPLDAARASQTIRHLPVAPPLHLQVRDEMTRILVGGEVVVELTRRSHDLIRWTVLLTQVDGPVHWPEVADRIWPGNPSADNWFKNRSRLSARLRRAGLPGDLLAMRDGRVWVAVRDGIDTLDVA